MSRHHDIGPLFREGKVTLQGRKPTQKGLKPGHCHGRRIRGHHQWRAHRTNRQDGMNGIGRIVVGHCHLGRRDRGERCRQSQHRLASRLQLDPSSARQQQGQIRLRHADIHLTGRQQSTGTPGYYLDVRFLLRKGEVAPQGRKTTHACHQTAHSDRCRVVRHSERSGQNRRTHGDGEVTIQVSACVVVDHRDILRRRTGKACSEAQFYRTPRLETHRLVPAQQQSHCCSLDTHTNGISSPQRGRCRLGHNHELVLGRSRTCCLLESKIAGNRDKPTHRRLESIEQESRHALIDLQRCGHRGSRHGHSQDLIDARACVVECDAHCFC